MSAGSIPFRYRVQVRDDITPERRSQVERTFHEALDRAADYRDRFLTEACGGRSRNWSRVLLEALRAEACAGKDGQCASRTRCKNANSVRLQNVSMTGDDSGGFGRT